MVKLNASKIGVICVVCGVTLRGTNKWRSLFISIDSYPHLYATEVFGSSFEIVLTLGLQKVSIQRILNSTDA